MKSSFLSRTASLIALIALTSLPFASGQEIPYTGEQIEDSGNLNPPPAPCCTCFRMYVEGVSDDSQHPDDGRLWPSINGEYRANVTIVYHPTPPVGTECSESVSVKVTGRVMADGIQVHEEVKSITVTETETEKTLAFVLPADLARQGGEWEFSSYCPGDADSGESVNDGLVRIDDSEAGCEPITIKLGGGCSSCTGSCPLTGEPSLNEEGDASFPTTTSDGDIRGELNFRPGGFSNPGTAALTANVPSGITVNRGPNGHITSVQTGTTLIEVMPAAPEILAADPNAFTVTHKATGQQNPFRTTTISFVTEDGAPRLRMDSTFDGATTRHELTPPTEPAFPSFNQVGTTYHLSKGRVTSNGFVPLSTLIYVKNEPTPGKSVQRRRMTERASANTPWFTSSDIETTYEKQIRGWVKTKEIIDPQGEALTSTWVYYQPGEITGPGGSTQGLGRLKQQSRYDGYETFHTYTLTAHTVTSPFAGNPAGKTTTSTWNPGAKSHTVTTTVGGHIVSKTVTAHTPTTSTRTVHTSAGQTLVTTTTYKTSGQDFGGRPALVVHPDGTRTVYSYTRNPDRGFTTQIDKLSAPSGTEPATGNRTITTTDPRGNTISRSTVAIGDADGAIMESMTVTDTEPLLGRPKDTLWLPAGVTTTTTYNCCGVSSKTDMYGIKTLYAYDGLQRLVKTNRLGVTTATVRDTRQTAFNNFEPTDWQLKGSFTKNYRYPETVVGDLSPGLELDASDLVSFSESNLARTSMTSGSPDPTSDTPGAMVTATTATTYLPSAPPTLKNNVPNIALSGDLGSLTVTTTPDNFSQYEYSYLDGSRALSVGQLAPDMIHLRTADTTGIIATSAYYDNDGPTGREITTTRSDWAGRTLNVTYQDGSVATMHYNSKGQMVKSVDPDGVTTLMAYNAKGERTITATDLNANGLIDYGTDTVQSSETVPALYESSPMWKTVTQVWKPGAAINQGTITSTSHRRADGLFSTSQTLNSAGDSTEFIDLDGGGNWEMTRISSDGTRTETSYADGLMVSSMSLDSNQIPIESITVGYDDWNRPVTETHSRTGPGTTTTAYLSATADVVKSVTVPGNRITTFAYDIRGRQIEVDAPDTDVINTDNGTTVNSLNVTTTAYNPDGTVQETSGDQTYRTTHTYDYARRMKTLTTYGTQTAVTTWNYSEDRGFLTRKQYNDGNGTDYDYTDAGRLATRTWQRSTVAGRITTTYGYDKGGRLTITGYSDDTPDVLITRDALGRPLVVKNGAGAFVGDIFTIATPLSSSTFTYDPDNLAVNTETVSHDIDLNGTPELTRVIDRSRDNLNRPNGWKLGTAAQYAAGWEQSGTPDLESQAAYTYDTAGRIGTISGGGLHPPSPFEYTYETNSYSLIKTITGPSHTVTNNWESTRNVLSSKENIVDTTNISTYQYGVNSLGQRTNVAQTGSAFSGVRDITWGYDSLGQVTKADHTIPGLGRAYVFDGIGNRLKAAEGTTDPEDPTATAYTPTALNQYDAIGTLNPDHDPDGNMTSGPLPANLSANSTLGWDAENRLVSASVPGGDTVTFFYDARSRRIAEKVGATTKITIYDGWNPIAEYLISNSQYQISKSYLWGMDLSGTLQGAGGVGGLLMVSEISNSQISNYYPTYDGNGNVSEYLNSSGTVVAHYEYDPFGKTTVATGPKANDFAHRFSTKPLDAATGLYYYGYRFYDPNTGRWPSRDPIGEKGGRNLYVMASNDTISLIDVLGLEETTYRDCNIKVFWGHSTASEQALMQENDKDGEKGCTAAGALGCSLNGTNNPARGRFGIFKNTWKTIPNFPNCASGRIGTRDHWDYHHRENTNGGYNPADTNRKSTDLEERTAAGFTMLAAMAWKAALEHSKEMCSYRCFPCICKQVTVEFICSSEDRTDEDLNERYNIGLKSGYLPANFDDGKLIKFELDPNNDYLEGYTTIGEGARKLPLCGEKLVLECLRNY